MSVESRKISEFPIKLSSELNGFELIPIVDIDSQGNIIGNSSIRLSSVSGSSGGGVQVCSLGQNVEDLTQLSLNNSGDIGTFEVQLTNNALIDGNIITVVGAFEFQGFATINIPGPLEKVRIVINDYNNPSGLPNISYSFGEIFGGYIDDINQVIEIDYRDSITISAENGNENSISFTLFGSVPEETCLTESGKLVVDTQNDFIVSENLEDNSILISPKFNGTFNQSGRVTLEEGFEEGTKVRFSLNMAKIAKNRVLPVPSLFSMSCTFTISFKNPQLTFTDRFLTGSLSIAPYANYYHINNQTSLQQVPPSSVGPYFDTLTSGSFYIEQAEYDGTFINFTLVYVGGGIDVTDYDMSGLISWVESADIG